MENLAGIKFGDLGQKNNNNLRSKDLINHVISATSFLGQGPKSPNLNSPVPNQIIMVFWQALNLAIWAKTPSVVCVWWGEGYGMGSTSSVNLATIHLHTMNPIS